MPRPTNATTILGRMAIGQVSGNRLLRAAYAGLSAAFRSFFKVAHIFWLQVTGLFFCAFAVMFALRVPRAYADHMADKSPKYHLVLLVGMVVMFAWFGVTSFWRARRK